MFEVCPISLWEADFSLIKRYIDSQKEQGVDDFSRFFRDKPGEIEKCLAMIKVINVNKASVKMFQAASKAELISRFQAVITSSGRSVFADALVAFVEGKDELSAEAAGLTLKGEPLDVALKLTIAPGAKETLTRILASLIDVTEYKRAEAGLRHSEENLRGLVESAPAMIIALNPEHKITEFNPEAERFFGVSKEDAAGSDYFLRFLAPAAAKEFGADIEEVMAGRQSKGFESQIKAADGQTHIVSWYMSRLVGPDSRPSGVIAVGNDVTDSRQTQSLSEALSKINVVVTSTMNADHIFAQVLMLAGEALESHSSVSLVKRNNELVVDHGDRMAPEHLGVKFTYESFPFLSSAERQKRPVIVDDFEKIHNGARRLRELWGVRSMMAVPLFIKGDVFGFLCFNFRAPRKFSDAQVDFASKLGASASLAVENARSFAEMRRALADSRTVGRIAARISQTLELEEVLDTALHEVLTALNINQGCIYVFDPYGNLVIRNSTELSRAFMEAKRVIAPGEGCAGEAAVSRRMFAPSEDVREFVCKESEELLGLDCLAAVPIVADQQSLGVLELFAPLARRMSARERQITETISNQLAVALQKAQLYADQRNIADTLQKALLTMPADEIPRIDFAFLYRSATLESAQVGGDFYDLFRIGRDKIGMVIGDVSGKGLSAATLTASVKNSLRAYAMQPDSPGEVMRKTNQIVLRSGGQFITAIYAVLDTATGELVYANAGHPHPILKRGRSVELLDLSSPVLGVIPDVDFREGRIGLGPGDTIVFYTDGVIEARRNSELFGETRLLDVVRGAGPYVKKLPQTIFETLREFSHDVLTDDSALLAVTLK